LELVPWSPSGFTCSIVAMAGWSRIVTILTPQQGQGNPIFDWTNIFIVLLVHLLIMKLWCNTSHLSAPRFFRRGLRPLLQQSLLNQSHLKNLRMFPDSVQNLFSLKYQICHFRFKVKFVKFISRPTLSF